jgi:hypothetical protein
MRRCKVLFTFKKDIFILLITSCLATSLFAKADKKLVNEYLKVSGAEEIILALPKQIENGYLKSIKIDELKDIDIKSKFDSKQTMDYMRQELVANFNDELLEHIIAFYKSPLGKKYRKNGIDAMSKKEMKKRVIFFKQMKKIPPSFNRINIMNAFVDRLEMTPVSVHLIGELLGSINAQLVSSNNTEMILGTVSDQIREYMFENSLYAYGDFTSKELKRIMDYYYTNAGRFEQLIVSKVFKQLIMESFAEIMSESQNILASLH